MAKKMLCKRNTFSMVKIKICQVGEGYRMVKKSIRESSKIIQRRKFICDKIFWTLLKVYSYCKPRPLNSWLVTCAVHSEMVHSTNSVIDLSEDELVPAVVYQISPFTLIRFSVRRREPTPAQA